MEREGAAPAHGAFSLFHNSPTSPHPTFSAKGSSHSLQQNNAQELRAYQLFGASQGPHPLAPLLRVPF